MGDNMGMIFDSGEVAEGHRPPDFDYVRDIALTRTEYLDDLSKSLTVSAPMTLGEMRGVVGWLVGVGL